MQYRLFQVDGVSPFHSHYLPCRFCAVRLYQSTTYYVWGCGFTGSHLDWCGIKVSKNHLTVAHLTMGSKRVLCAPSQVAFGLFFILVNAGCLAMTVSCLTLGVTHFLNS